jgi:hypothetical protein
MIAMLADTANTAVHTVLHGVKVIVKTYHQYVYGMVLLRAPLMPRQKGC